jgi:hypothetical protein
MYGVNMSIATLQNVTAHIPHSEFFGICKNVMHNKWADIDRERRIATKWCLKPGQEIVLDLIKQLRDFHTPMIGLMTYTSLFCTANNIRGLGMSFYDLDFPATLDMKKLFLSHAFDRVIDYCRQNRL